MSLSSKLNAWIKSPQGQARLQSKLEEYNRNGVKETAAGDSVMKHIDGMSSSGIIQTGDGFEIPLYFEGDLHRDSLENDLGYSGIDNIVALFNNGYHAQNYVYGWWDNHSPSGEAVGRSLYNDDYAWVRSKKERDALKFIQQAINDFNGNYGSEYNITAVIAADIYEQ